MSASSDQPIILYHYAESPFTKRILWYLGLRSISYIQCIQPKILPRPDIARLGIKYRRIPILAVGRDVYLDTRLMLHKLEQLALEKPRLVAESSPEQRAMETLLEVLVMDGGLFKCVALLMPSDRPQIRDPAFIKDRADFIGGAMIFPPEALAAARPEAVNEVKEVVELLETILLADGREWLLKTQEPSLADIEAVWPLHWFLSVPGALPQDHISAELFSIVFAWIERFQVAVSTAELALGASQTGSSEEATDILVTSLYNEEEGQFDTEDPVVQKQSLKKGKLVQFWPTDTGSAYKDVGKLVGIDSKRGIHRSNGWGYRSASPCTEAWLLSSCLQ